MNISIIIMGIEGVPEISDILFTIIGGNEFTYARNLIIEVNCNLNYNIFYRGAYYNTNAGV